MKKQELTAENLKTELWDTFQALRAKKLDFHTALATATTSREIMRVIKMELHVAALLQKKPNQKLLNFTT